MIPQRIAIEGFMSFRERVELTFEGAPIWVLTGENGAGKSTVFDAITFALYGLHRNGKQHVEEIINRGCDRLAIEFDFMLGEDCYQVQRTASRRGRASYQVVYLSGPHAPVPGHRGPQPVPETDSRDGFSRWVDEHLGMDDKSFLMSVLLRQGESDALLKAGAAERHELLSKLVDLSRYKSLHDRADKYYKDARDTARRCKQKLEKLPIVDEAELARLAEAIEQAQMQIQTSQRQLEQVAGLKVHAQHWAAWQAQRDELARMCEEMRKAQEDADAIEKDAARAAELRMVLPYLTHIVEDNRRRNEQLRQAEQAQSRAVQLALDLETKQEALKQAQAELEQVQQAKAEAEARQVDALQRHSALSEHIHRLNQLDEQLFEVAKCEEALKSFPEDLQEHLEQVQQEVKSLERLKSAQPWLAQYVEARNQWRSISNQIVQVQQIVAESQQRVADAAAQLRAAEDEGGRVQAQVEQARAQKSAADAALKSVQEQLARFDQVAGEPTCPYCGQALTEAHLVVEEARLRDEVTEKSAASSTAASTLAEALAARNEAASEVDRCKADYENAGAAQVTAEREQQILMQKCADAESRGQHALEVLRSLQTSEIPLPAATAVADCFADETPTEAELTQIDMRVSGLAEAQQLLSDLQAAQAQQAQQQSKLQTLQSQLAPLVQRYSETQAQALRAEYSALEVALNQTALQIKAYEETVQAVQIQHNQLANQVRVVEESRRTAAEDAARMRLLAEQLQESMCHAYAALPLPWQEHAFQVSAEQVKSWQEELGALHGTEQRLEELQHARADLVATQRRLDQIETELESIPTEARQPLSKLEALEAKLRVQQQQAEAEWQQYRDEKQKLEYQLKEIGDLSVEKRNAEKQASLFQQLAQLLGREFLQRYLLQQAETSIVAYANTVLDRCSGGMLRMELRQNEDGESGQRAFDLVVHNHATSDEPLPAWLLSGSQRFRVAISLALGIGQFASTNSRRIESVIIDEGFGSLDRNGLRDMAETLRDLSNTLRRVILVSHQDDFAKAFSRRYHIALVDGASRLVDEPE